MMAKIFVPVVKLNFNVRINAPLIIVAPWHNGLKREMFTFITFILVLMSLLTTQVHRNILAKATISI